MNSVRTATFVALACIPLLGACERSTPPAPRDADAPATSLGKVVEEATEKARTKLANEPITLTSDDGNLPKAEISPKGDLVIDGKTVPVTEEQRAMLLEHRANIVAIADAGMTIGVRGADLGMKAAGEALRGVFSGNTEEIGKRIEAEAEKIKADARVLCDRLPAMLASQQKLAAAVPEFKPYATMTAQDVDDCRDETVSESEEPAAPPVAPAPPAPPAPPEG